MGENTPSVSDIRAVIDASNGSNAYPVYANGFGNNGFGNGDSWVWLILILALCGGFGNGNGFGGGFGGNNEYAWLSNGQKEIMQNTNDGFNTLQLANQLSSVNNGINGLSTQLCNCCGDISQQLCNGFAGVNSTINSGFANAETSANARQMANMQQSFNNQLSTLQGFNSLSSQFADCCCENRLATQDLKATVISENCQDREVLRQIGQDILVNQTANTQKIIDEIFRDRLDEKDDKIADLNRQLQLADLRASQIAQTQAITSNIYNELKNCPVGTVPVFGNQPIFTCSGNNGCACNGFNGTL